jgi:hypothetical protein
MPPLSAVTVTSAAVALGWLPDSHVEEDGVVPEAVRLYPVLREFLGILAAFRVTSRLGASDRVRSSIKARAKD